MKAVECSQCGAIPYALFSEGPQRLYEAYVQNNKAHLIWWIPTNIAGNGIAIGLSSVAAIIHAIASVLFAAISLGQYALGFQEAHLWSADIAEANAHFASWIFAKGVPQAVIRILIGNPDAVEAPFTREVPSWQPFCWPAMASSVA